MFSSVQFLIKCVRVLSVSSSTSLFKVAQHFRQRYVASGVILACVVTACLSVQAFFVARSKISTSFASMPGGEGETSQATPAVLQNVPFPSKVETKGKRRGRRRCSHA